MTKLTRALKRFIYEDSLMGTSHEDNINELEFKEFKNETTVEDESMGLFGAIFEVTVPNIVDNIKFFDGCDEFEQMKRKFHKKNLKDFTLDELFELIDYFDQCNNGDCSIFGVGSDSQNNWEITTIDGTQYLMCYGRY